MISIDEQQAILLSIARELKKQVTAFAVGGTAMMFLGLKNSTMDIDLVFESIESREEFIKAAGKIGFSSLDSAAIYGKRENIPEMLKLDDFRLDLFVSNVIDFIFSEESAYLKSCPGLSCTNSIVSSPLPNAAAIIRATVMFGFSSPLAPML
ncbi:hypothetical protein HYT92_01090 [Candidatus Pacearchaeota archaeon]|nr:hypothetical protein [Candidatus Pacearchaeota archaeon]